MHGFIVAALWLAVGVIIGLSAADRMLRALVTREPYRRKLLFRAYHSLRHRCADPDCAQHCPCCGYGPAAEATIQAAILRKRFEERVEAIEVECGPRRTVN